MCNLGFLFQPKTNLILKKQKLNQQPERTWSCFLRWWILLTNCFEYGNTIFVLSPNTRSIQSKRRAYLVKFSSVKLCGTLLRSVLRMSSRSLALGIPISISRSSLPGLRRAGSKASGRLVAAKTITWPDEKLCEMETSKKLRCPVIFFSKTEEYEYVCVCLSVYSSKLINSRYLRHPWG